MDVERVTRELKARSNGSSRRSLQTSSGSSVPSSSQLEETSQQEHEQVAHVPGRTTSPLPPPSESSMTSSIELTGPPPAPLTGEGVNGQTGDESSAMGDSVSILSVSVSTNAQSWVDEFNSQMGSSVAGDVYRQPELSMPGPSTRTSMPSPLSHESGLAGSVTSGSLVSTSESEKAHVGRLHA